MEMGSDDSEGFSTPPASLQPDEPAEPADPAEEDKDLEWATIMPQVGVAQHVFPRGVLSDDCLVHSLSSP